MEISVEKRKEYVRRLLISRTRLLVKNGFFGLLLMNVEFALDEEIPTASTDGEKIYVAPRFLDALDDKQLDFVLMHEVMHMALSHCVRGLSLDPFQYNIACDIVVNSTILKCMPELEGITVCGVPPMRYAPDGKDGANYTAEEVYAMLVDPSAGKGKSQKEGDIGEGDGSDGKSATGEGKKKRNKGAGQGGEGSDGLIDSHDKWKEGESDEAARERAEIWKKRVADAAEAVLIRDPSDSRGTLPLFAARILRELKNPQTDWRTLLADFLSEERVDYSFTPPDRRLDGPFFLPDFNEYDMSPIDVLFMIDTSGSMSDDQVLAAYSEVKGAVDQFNGKLRGLLGFFDAAITEPKPFCDETELLSIKPYGGGGTSFEPIFDWANERAKTEPITGIIILTDGYAPYPPEGCTEIPTIWIVNNERQTPPWGRVARIK